jgi:DNA-binding XRE family transcriptional regulator
MKAFVRFEGHNAGDYWGQRMVVVDTAEQADYELLLQDKDRLVMDPELGTLLVRNKIEYLQVERMIKFKGVNFAPWSDCGREADPDEPSVQCKLLKINRKPFPESPTPDAIREARNAKDLTQTEAAALVYSTLRAWQQWEDGTRKMHPAMFELFTIKSQ